MAETVRIEIAALNIVASPHPSGIYRRILEQVSDLEVPLWGSDRAKITKPQELGGRTGVLFGQILVWAEIDTEGKWLNKAKNVEATPEEKKKAVDALPPDLEPNFRPFTYFLVEAKHRLVFEVHNEFGQNLAPARAERLFARLFRKLPPDSPAVEITVIPEDETLEKILAIPRLRKLDILVKRPNADDIGDEFKKVMDTLEEEGARSQKIEKVKAPKEKTLKPNAATRILALIGSRLRGGNRQR
jgi:hypothetical protein